VAGRVRALYVEDGAEGAARDIATTAAKTAAAFQVASAQLGTPHKPLPCDSYVCACFHSCKASPRVPVIYLSICVY
jgi:uncharacterized protein GlcG (DUF336 family)